MFPKFSVNLYAFWRIGINVPNCERQKINNNNNKKQLNQNGSITKNP